LPPQNQYTRFVDYKGPYLVLQDIFRLIMIFSPVKAENIIMIELDMPNRTTRDYEGPAVAPKVQAALDAALQDEEDLTLDAE